MEKYHLICSVCGKPIENKLPPYCCSDCGGLAEPDFDLARNAEHYRAVIRNGCRRGVWDYKDLLPADGLEELVSLGEGNTPLLRAQNLAEIVGVGQLFLKNETLNPSGTYKDRFATVAITLEKARRAPAVALGSAGNAAASVAAYSAKAGVPCFVLLPPGAVAERAWQVRGYGAKLIRLEHTIDDCIHISERGEELFGWKSLTTNMLTNPLPTDGYKTIGYEIGKQLDFRMPDWIVVPVGGAALFNKVYRACRDMMELGLIDKMPRFVGAQASGCAPMVEAYRQGLKDPKVWPGVPDTVAFAIADIRVYDGITAMNILETTGGCAEDATDEEILEAMRQIANREGVLAEPASACTVACVKKLAMKGVIKPEDSVLCILSGSGMRDLKLLEQAQKKEVPFVKHRDEEAVKAAVKAYLEEQEEYT